MLVAAGYYGLVNWKTRTARNLALQAVAQSDWAQLAQVTTVWRELQPNNNEARFLAGLAAEHRGASVQALQLYESVQPSQPKFYSQARWRLALLALAADSPRDAEDYLTASIESDGLNLAAWREWLRYLGMTYQQNLARQQAFKAIESGADSPATYVYLMACDLVTYRDGETRTASWAQDDPQPETFEVASFLHAVKRESLSETPEDGEASVANDAIVTGSSTFDARFNKLIERYPQNTDLLFLQMERALEAGDQSRLASLLSRLPSSAADDPRSWRLRGQWLQLQDRLDEASEAYRAAIDKYPYDARPYQFLSEIARLRGNEQEASRLQDIATTGNSLRRMIYSQREIDELDQPVFEAMKGYAEKVKQPIVAQQLEQRLRTFRSNK